MVAFHTSAYVVEIEFSKSIKGKNQRKRIDEISNEQCDETSVNLHATV